LIAKLINHLISNFAIRYYHSIILIMCPENNLQRGLPMITLLRRRGGNPKNKSSVK